ncbi:hypothetical protein [Nonomuraea sp. NPDC049028]|uniref:hypothetical protein n=1 Tax=Nonomuraea sp. NPDC049028 TaxID=3364348 RepID=UPI003714416B
MSAELVVGVKSDDHRADLAADWLSGALADFAPGLESLLTERAIASPVSATRIVCSLVIH